MSALMMKTLLRRTILVSLLFFASWGIVIASVVLCSSLISFAEGGYW